MSIKVQRVEYGSARVVVTVLLKRDVPVGPGESAGDYGSLDVSMAAPAPIEQHVAAIKKAVADYLVTRADAAEFAQELEAGLAAVEVG